MRNNIFVNKQNNTATSGSKNYSVFVETASSPFTTINYNDYHAESTANSDGITGFLTADKIELSDWKMATGADLQSVAISPVFTSNSNLHLTSANPALDNLGQPIGGITQDIDAQTRSGSTPDMGADEFAGIVQVALTVFIEGYMDGAAMRPVKMNSGIGANGSLTDAITVELHNATAPYALSQSATADLMTNGTATVQFTSSAFGNNYYLVVKNRNCLETWSAMPLSLSAFSNYNFTTAAGQAFGSNLKQVGSVWALYSGEMNTAPDGKIDILDFAVWETDYNNFSVGYFTGDLNGDGVVDLLDYPIWEANYVNLIEVEKP